MIRCFLHSFSATALTVMIIFANSEVISQESFDQLVPHRAFYTMSTKKTASSTAFVNVEGRLSFEIRELCASWTVEQRHVMLYQRDDGSEIQINTFLSSWEEKTGEQYKFFVKRDESNGVEKVIEGKAIVPKKSDAGGNVKFSKPEPNKFTLNKKTLFPAGHTVALIKAAKSKKKIVRHFLFDGTEVEPAALVNSIIGVQKTYVGGLAKLDKTTYWPIRMAFFLAEKQKLEPEYEITIRLHDNGVVSGLILDYGDLIIDVELMEIDYLQRPSCS